MTIIKKISTLLALLSIPAVTTLYSACYGEDTFKSRPSNVCNWERGDGRCNIDGDCCPGRECSAFGFCQSCS